jgi:hypothetical protein
MDAISTFSQWQRLDRFKHWTLLFTAETDRKPSRIVDRKPPR